MISLAAVRDLVRQAHAGQVDKQGRDYLTAHLEPISALLAEHGEDAEMAGLLHDILEDTRTTSEELLEAGVPAHVVRAVESVSKRPGEPYDELIERAASDPLGRLVKLADNRWNLDSNAALAEVDPVKAHELRLKYEKARARLLRPVEE